ncbi:MAG: ATP-binding protein [bacterium]
MAASADDAFVNDPRQNLRLESLFAIAPEAWMAAIVESSDDAIVGKTLDGIIRSWNAGAARIFGYAPSEIIGRSVLELIPPELRGEEAMIVERLSRGERVDHYETVRLRRDGTRVEISLSVSPIRDAAGSVIGAAKIARDMTEHNRLRKMERDLTEALQETAAELEQQVEEGQSLQEELEQTNADLLESLVDAERARLDAESANAAKARFLATMSHELRTPLNAIAGYVDLIDLELRGPVTAGQRHDLSRIKRSQETLLRLIEDVLTFAKLESGRQEFNYEDVKLDEFLGTLEIFVAPGLERKRLTYSLDACPDVVVPMDRAKVEQILLNLLSNAVKFTNRGEVRVSCRVEDERVHIRVSDTGHGIRPDLLETIFEAFVQGDRSLTRTVEGTGLGLSISRQLARAMGGEILVESTVGEGSTFTVVIPLRRV